MARNIIHVLILQAVKEFTKSVNSFLWQSRW